MNIQFSHWSIFLECLSYNLYGLNIHACALSPLKINSGDIWMNIEIWGGWRYKVKCRQQLINYFGIRVYPSLRRANIFEGLISLTFSQVLVKYTWSLLFWNFIKYLPYFEWGKVRENNKWKWYERYLMKSTLFLKSNSWMKTKLKQACCKP